jgi:general secretion pathway protein I
MRPIVPPSACRATAWRASRTTPARGWPWTRLNCKGFTLFEALAATMILATALVTILQLFSGGMRSGHLADQYTRAVLHAREKMEEILLAPQMADETLSGPLADGFAWRAEIVMQDPEENGAPPADGLALFYVHLQVDWEEGRRQVDLKTLTLAKVRDDAL